MGSETIANSDDSRDTIVSGITPSYPWSASSELALFQALISNKPAGINKHFAMAVVSEKLSSQFGSEMTSDVIWAKLRTMFDLSACDDREEVIPFTLEEKEFALPRKDFVSLIIEKQKEINKDKSSGIKSTKGVTRINQDMSSDTGRRDRIEKETPAPVKETKVKADIKEAKEESTPTTKAQPKRHVTRSTPNNTPAKKRK